MRKAFFLDRDGVINEEVDYLHKPEDVVLCPGVGDAIRKIHEAGYLAVVVSNQSGIARGMFTLREVRAVERRILEMLEHENARPDAFYYCPHHKDGTVPEFTLECDCRKPRPGLLLKAIRDLGIDPSASFLIGDQLSDLRAGEEAGCRAVVMVATGHGVQNLEKARAEKRIVKSGLPEAVEYLLSL